MIMTVKKFSQMQTLDIFFLFNETQETGVVQILKEKIL